MYIYKGKRDTVNNIEPEKVGEWPLTIDSNDIVNAEYNFKNNIFSIGLYTHRELPEILGLHQEDYSIRLSVRMTPGKITCLLLCYHHDTGFKAPARKRFYCKLSGKESALLSSIIIRGLSFLIKEALAEKGEHFAAVEFAEESLIEIVEEIEAAKREPIESVMKRLGIEKITKYGVGGTNE